MKQRVKYFVLLLLALGFGSQGVRAQKLVIGSELPSLKGIQWQSSSPNMEQPIFIEFYHHGNSSSRRFIERISEVEKSSSGQIQIVILTRDSEASLSFLNDTYGERYMIGYDPTGSVFRSFGVKYIPYSMLINRKREVVWIGNLGRWNIDIINQIR